MYHSVSLIGAYLFLILIGPFYAILRSLTLCCLTGLTVCKLLIWFDARFHCIRVNDIEKDEKCREAVSFDIPGFYELIIQLMILEIIYTEFI